MNRLAWRSPPWGRECWRCSGRVPGLRPAAWYGDGRRPVRGGERAAGLGDGPRASHGTSRARSAPHAPPICARTRTPARSFAYLGVGAYEALAPRAGPEWPRSPASSTGCNGAGTQRRRRL